MPDRPQPEASRPEPSRAQEILQRALGSLEQAERAQQGAAGPARPGALVSPESGPEHEKTLEEVMRRARDVTSILDLEPLLDRVLEAFVVITGAERACLLLMADGGTLHFRRGHHLTEAEFADQPHVISQGATRDAAQTGKSVFVADVLTAGLAVRDSVALLGLRSYNCVPLVAGGRVLGVCYSDSRLPGRLLAARDRDLLEAFAAHAAVAIENARRHSALAEAANRLEAENEGLRRQIERRYRFTSILGESAAMERLFATLEKVVASQTTVLLQGETGTGKELLARAIHANGPRRDKPYVAVNVGALPESLLESEMFGHRRGAFTSAVEDHRGLFEEADQGTLFLDEIGEMPAPLQVKLLRVLQEGEVRRIGENTVRKVDVRLLAATNRDLAAEVKAGRFREDLYYRLNVVGIRVPPLRERGNDVLLLAEEFVRRYGRSSGKKNLRLGPDAARWIASYGWPGNVRELQNCIERAVTLSEGGTLSLEALRPALGPGATAGWTSRGTLRDTLAAVEKDEVRRTLEECGGRVADAARRLGISRQYLHTLQRKHGLHANRERRP